MKELTVESFSSEVEKSDKPVLVDFWAPWCGPCKMMTPILEKLEAERKDLIIAKVNVDTESDLAKKFEISSIPTCILFRDGKEVARMNGVKSATALKDMI
jgi:thioredoxin 1